MRNDVEGCTQIKEDEVRRGSSVQIEVKLGGNYFIKNFGERWAVGYCYSSGDGTRFLQNWSDSSRLELCGDSSSSERGDDGRIEREQGGEAGLYQSRG